MAFNLGDFKINEILYGSAEYKNNILFTLDQINNGQIEISAESTDFTDKNGNVVKTIYKSKTGTFTATNAFLHPQIMNASSGSDLEVATTTNQITMPRFKVCEAGKTIDLSDAEDGTIKIIGIFGNGGNSVAMTTTEVASVVVGNQFAAPAQNQQGTNPIQYLVSYDRKVGSGIKLVNEANKFPSTYKLTFLASYVDPCADDLKPCYVVIPKFMPDPSVTISLSRETQEMDFKGNLNVDFCSANKALYYIYFPDEDLVVPGEYTDATVDVPYPGEG